MRGLRAWMLRVKGMLDQGRRDRQFAEEIEAHVAMQVEENMRAGMSAEEARREAIVKHGGVEQAKQTYRERNTLPVLERLVQDLRFAVRQLSKNMGFAATAVLMLGLGIGASVAIFAFVDAALVQPLPFAEPKRVVSVFETVASCPRCNVSYLNFRDWQKTQGTSAFFASLEAWGYSNYLMRGAGGVQTVQGMRVTDGFFRALGVKPMLGRDFYAGEDAPGKPLTTLVSYGTWKTRFGGDSGVVGKTVMLSGDAVTVIGVMPREFHFAARGTTDFWVPLNVLRGCEKRRGCHGLNAVARLKDGVTMEGAAAGMQAVAERMAKTYPANVGYGADVVGMSEVVAGKVRPVLLVLLGGAGLLLLIACVNVASLLLVRSESRRREIAVRSALGATRIRIGFQFVVEGMVLVALGSGLGLGAAYGAMRLLVKLIPKDMMNGMPYLMGLGLHPRVLGFAGVIAFVALVLFSVTPALRLRGEDLQAGMAEGGRGSAGMLWRRLGSKMVMVEIATAVVLLVCAGLLGKSLYRLMHVETGMRPEHVVSVEVLVADAETTNERMTEIEQRMVERVRRLPGVESVGVTTVLPVHGWGIAANIVVPGRASDGKHHSVTMRNVSDEYLQTLGATLMRGRYFTAAEDDVKKPGLAVVNQRFAAQFFPGEDAVGKRIAYEGAKDSMEIVGLVTDIKEGQLDSAAEAAFYVPYTQGWFEFFSVVARTSGKAEGLVAPMTAAVREVDRDAAVDEGMTMSAMLEGSESAYMHRSSAWLVAGFAGLALVLSVVGLYGVIAYSVSQRAREIGVRMALGAQRRAVYGLILREAGWLTAIGLAVGLVCAVGAARLMREQLFGVQVWDAGTLAAVVGVLGAAAMLASYLPARRAASINPVDALRAE